MILFAYVQARGGSAHAWRGSAERPAFQLIDIERRIHAKHPLRLIRAVVNAVVKLLQGVIAHPRVRRLLSREHFSVDGTLIDARASMKPFRRGTMP